MVHALQLSASHFNDLLTWRRKKIIKGMRDGQLAQWLEDSSETLTELFPSDVSAALVAAQARRMDGLLSLASPAVSQPASSNHLAAAGSTFSFRSRHTEPYTWSSTTRPCHGGTLTQAAAEGANSTTGIITSSLPPMEPVPETRTMETPSSRPIPSPPTEVGGRLPHFLQHWEVIGEIQQFSTPILWPLQFPEPD